MIERLTSRHDDRRPLHHCAPFPLHIGSRAYAKTRMNECRKSGSGQGAFNDRLWVVLTVGQGGRFRPLAEVRERDLSLHLVKALIRKVFEPRLAKKRLYRFQRVYVSVPENVGVIPLFRDHTIQCGDDELEELARVLLHGFLMVA